jgi:predicted GIY-YIG superfamily endonuclease
MTYGYIYKIQFPNGKHYIGQTICSLEKRKREHKSAAKSGLTNVLYNALRKYEMVDTFELIEIDKADTSEELSKKEILYIQEYNSYYMDGNGYNMTFGGEGANGYVYTENDKLRFSEAQKKRFENPEEKEN